MCANTLIADWSPLLSYSLFLLAGSPSLGVLTPQSSKFLSVPLLLAAVTG